MRCRSFERRGGDDLRRREPLDEHGHGIEYDELMYNGDGARVRDLKSPPEQGKELEQGRYLVLGIVMHMALVKDESMADANILFWVILTLVTYSLVGVLAFLFAFKPGIFVRYQANNLRQQYKQRAKMSDEEIDRRFKPFWFSFMIDSMSHFVNQGVEHPEEFPRLMLWYRGIGCFIGAIVAFAVFFLLWGLATGGLSASR